MPLEAPVTIAARSGICSPFCRMTRSSHAHGRGKAVGSIPHFTGTVWPGPRLKPTPRRGRARSSVGQSCRLIIGRSLVRVQPGPCVEPLQTRALRIYRKAMRRDEGDGTALRALVEGVQVDPSERVPTRVAA